MIPPFGHVTGNLPPGVHVVPWPEVMARFGHTPRRLALLAGLDGGLDALRAAGCRRTYLDGSFVTAKEAHYNAPPELFDLRPGRPARKARFGGEPFPAKVPADAAGV